MAGLRKRNVCDAAALVLDNEGTEVYAKDADQALPIASITKLMTAMVILDADLPLQEKIRINRDDRDLIQLTGSRLTSGATLTRQQLLQLALMSSENRAAAALEAQQDRIASVSFCTANGFLQIGHLDHRAIVRRQDDVAALDALARRIGVLIHAAHDEALCVGTDAELAGDPRIEREHLQAEVLFDHLVIARLHHVFFGIGIELLLLAQLFLARTLADRRHDTALLAIPDEIDRNARARCYVRDEE